MNFQTKDTDMRTASAGCHQHRGTSSIILAMVLWPVIAVQAISCEYNCGTHCLLSA